MSLFARDTKRLSRHKLALRHHTPSKNSTPKPYPTSKTQTIIHSPTKHNPIHNLNTRKNTSYPPTHSQQSTQKTPSSFSPPYFLPEQRPPKPLSFHEPQSSLNGKNLSRLNHPNFTLQTPFIYSSSSFLARNFSYFVLKRPQGRLIDCIISKY